MKKPLLLLPTVFLASLVVTAASSVQGKKAFKADSILDERGLASPPALSELQIRSSLVLAQNRPSPYVDFLPLPADLKGLIESVDLVVYAKSENSPSPVAEPGNRGRLIVRRYYRLRVLQVISGIPALNGGLLSVRLVGGTVDVKGKEVSSEYLMPLFAPAESMILFLKRVGSTHAYDVAYGPNGVMRMDVDGTVRIPHGARRVRELKGADTISLRGFLDLVQKVR
jgi:hypothetical protein